MNPYDDMGALSGYFAEFTTAGSMPTALGGHGYSRPLGALAPSPRLPPQPAGTAQVTASKVNAAVLQNYLNAVAANVTKTGLYDAQTEAAWKKYVAVFKEPHAELAPMLVDGLEDRKNVHISAEALGRLSARAQATGKLRAEAARPIGSRPNGAPTPSKAPSPTVVANTDELQKIMIALGVAPKNITDGKLGPTTKAKWQAATKARGLTTTITGKTGARNATVNRKTLLAMRAAVKPAATPVVAGAMVANTTDVQSTLKRLGFKDNRLDDGLYGPTTLGLWGEAATKRQLDPFMAKKSADGKTVTVSERTYLMLKADADAKAPPVPTATLPAEPVGGTLRDMLKEGKAVIATSEEMKLLLNRFGSTDADLARSYGSIAKSQGLDPRVEKVSGGFLVVKVSLDALVKIFGEMAPPKPPPGPQLTALEKNVAAVVKSATGTIPVNTVRMAINAAIQDKRVAASPVTPTGPWENGLRPLLMSTLQVSGPLALAWENALMPGQLVSKDGKTLKLPPAAVDFLNRAAASLKAAVKQAEDFKGFTEVNASQVIARINGLSVTSVKFDPSGDAKVLSDAIKTFLEETKSKIPTGALVRLNIAKTKVYVKDSVMQSLAAAVTAAQARADVTKKFRVQMVANALQSMTAKVSISQLQTAFVETTRSGKAGKNAKLFGAVKVTGAFDAPTRAAYTELARTSTIGPAIQEYQALLQRQLGPNFKAALVVEARNQVWGSVLDQSVSGGSISMLPALANQVQAAASAVKSRMTADAARKKEASDVLAAQSAALGAAVKKSTAIVSVLDLQMALSQMMATKEIDPVSAVKRTGRGDGPTKKALFEMSGLIFPQGSQVSEILWGRYLNEVGIIVVSAAQVKKGWPTANYIALPVSVADLVSKKGGEYVVRNGQPAAAGALMPLPLKNEQLRLRFKTPSVVTVRRPPPDEVVITEADKKKPLPKAVAKQVVEAKRPAAKTGEEEQAAAERQAAAKAKQAQETAAAETARLAAGKTAADRAARSRAAAEQAGARAKAGADARATQEAAARDAEARAAAGVARQAAAAAAEASAQAQRTRDASAEAAAQAAQEEAARRVREAEQRARVAEAAAAAAQQQLATPAPVVAGPTITGPTIRIETTAPAPALAPQVQQAGMLSGGMAGPLLILAAVGAVGYTLAQQRGEEPA